MSKVKILNGRHQAGDVIEAGSDTSVLNDKVEEVKKQTIDLYFYRERKDSNRSATIVSNYAPVLSTENHTGTPWLECPSGKKDVFTHEICKLGLMAFGLHTKDAEFPNVVHLRLTVDKKEQNVFQFKFEETGFQEFEPKGPNWDAIDRALTMKGRYNDEEEDGDSDEPEDEDEADEVVDEDS